MSRRKFLTTVRRKKEKGKSHKEGVFLVERRKHPRIRVELPFDYSPTNSQEIHRGMTADASEGGLLVYLSEVVELGALLKMEILFVKGVESTMIKAITKVVWSDLASRERWGEFRYGLEFQSFQEGDLSKLKTLLKEVAETHT